MAHDFKGLVLEASGRLPNYRDFIFSTDMTSAYDYHKQAFPPTAASRCAGASGNLKDALACVVAGKHC